MVDASSFIHKITDSWPWKGILHNSLYTAALFSNKAEFVKGSFPNWIWTIYETSNFQASNLFFGWLLSVTCLWGSKWLWNIDLICWNTFLFQMKDVYHLCLHHTISYNVTFSIFEQVNTKRVLIIWQMPLLYVDSHSSYYKYYSRLFHHQFFRCCSLNSQQLVRYEKLPFYIEVDLDLVKVIYILNLYMFS